MSLTDESKVRIQAQKMSAKSILMNKEFFEVDTPFITL